MNANQNDYVLVGPYDRKYHVHYDETKLICDYISRHVNVGIMLDVGAHCGSSLACFLDKNWLVYGFEPDPHNRTRLMEKFGKHPQLKIFDLAVSDESGQDLSFYACNESTGISSLLAFHKHHHEVCKVKTITLTDICLQENITTVDVLKIDAEGHDLLVLRGFPWDKIKPKIVACEFEDNKTNLLGYDFHRMANFLVDKGYHVYVSEWHPILRYGIRHDWQRIVKYPCELSDLNSWGNLLAFWEPPNEALLINLVRKQLRLPIFNVARGLSFFSLTQVLREIPILANKIGNRIWQVLSVWFGPKK